MHKNSFLFSTFRLFTHTGERLAVQRGFEGAIYSVFLDTGAVYRGVWKPVATN